MGLTMRGSELGATTNPAGTYVAYRPLRLLRELGAVTADEAAVLDRADKILLGNMNDTAEAAEVANLFRDDVTPTLFDEERSVLPHLWQKYLIANAQFTRPAVPELAVTPVAGSMGSIDPEKPFAIADLPQEMQRIARRVQLTIDRDRQPPTIQYADIVKALEPGNANKYTVPELQQIEELKRRFLEEILPRGVEAPSITVPPLGQHRLGLADFSGVKAELVTKTELRLSQAQTLIQSSTTIRPNGTIDVSNQLQLTRAGVGIDITFPAEHCLVVISNSGQQIYRDGKAVLPPQPGPYILELYDASGRKLADQSFEVPAVDSRADLAAEHLGKTVLGSDGQTYVPQLEKFQATPIRHNNYSSRSDYRTGTQHAAEWSFVPAGTEQHHGDVAAARAAFTWSGGSLKDGTYSFDVEEKYRGQSFGAQHCVLEKYPGPCFGVTLNNQKLWLVPYGPSNYSGAEYNGRRLYRAYVDRLEVTFEPETNELTVTRWPTSGSEGRFEHEVSADDFSEAGDL